MQQARPSVLPPSELPGEIAARLHIHRARLEARMQAASEARREWDASRGLTPWALSHPNGTPTTLSAEGGR